MMSITQLKFANFNSFPLRKFIKMNDYRKDKKNVDVYEFYFYGLDLHVFLLCLIAWQYSI
jgi:hypothetical protein